MYNFTNNKIQYNKLKQPTHHMLMSMSDHSVHIIKYVFLDDYETFILIRKD